MTFLLLLASGLVVLYAASYYNAQDKGSALSARSIPSSWAWAWASRAWRCCCGWTIALLQRKPIICRWRCVGVSLLMLTLVAIPGVGRMLNGSRRWLRLGPVSFQPSELAKYAAILFMARALSTEEPGSRRGSLRGWLPLFVVPGVMFLLILLQPNLSTAGSILIVSAVMVMLAGARWKHLGMVGAAGLALGTFYALSEDYRRARLMSRLPIPLIF